MHGECVLELMSGLLNLKFSFKRFVESNMLKKSYLFLLLCVGFIYLQPFSLHALTERSFTYYLNVQDFIDSFIEIPTSNVSGSGTTISSKYLAGRAPLYNQDNLQVGTCSASFLCMQTADGIFTDISNYISVDSGLIVTWFTPTTLINLELDTIVNSMVTECIVEATTKVLGNPFYGQTFNLVVSSDTQRIYFQFSRTGTIF